MSGARGRKREGRPARRPSAAVEKEPHSGRTPGERVMVAALKLIATRSYSERELRDRLVAKPWAETGLVEDCLKRLKELGYVNDDLFAHSYASYRVRSKPVGRARLKRELAFKKVAPGAIDQALDLVFDESAEETLIDRAIRRRVRLIGKPQDRAAARRMFDHLARLGFEYDLIVRKLRELKAGSEDNDE